MSPSHGGSHARVGCCRDGRAGPAWLVAGARLGEDVVEEYRAKIEDAGGSSVDENDIGARANVSSSADAVLNQSAFDQNITQGANIQFNSITIQSAGHDLHDGGDTL